MQNKTSYTLDTAAILAAGPALSPYQEGQPEVLIVHTHTTESYLTDGAENYEQGYNGRSTKLEENMVAVGETFREALEAKGVKVLHDTTLNDYPSYNGAYTRTEKVIAWYLQKYPSIRVVVDLHRDSMTTDSGLKYRTVAEVEGKRAAQVMIIAGSAQGGLEHPDWQRNLALGILWQQAMEKQAPGLARPLNLVEYRYNEHMTHGSLLMEIGTDANSLVEAKTAADYAATSLAGVLTSLH